MKAQKVGKMAIFSVGAVLFSAHAGGGFATGNQANTYYVGIGWTGIVSAIIAMLLLILTMREAMVMYNQRNLTSAKELFENATDINFFVGRAVNPAHQNPDLPINFNIKMNLVEELSACLKQMGKRIKVSYF